MECNNGDCHHAEADNYNDSVAPGLAIPDGVDLADPAIPLPPITEAQLPHCPLCGSLMRPSVVLFSEKLYQNSIDIIEEWYEKGPIELLLVIGTSALVSPAADYIDRAWEMGARIAIINTDAPKDDVHARYGDDHWYFQGDAAFLLPELFKGVLEPCSIADARVD